MSNQFPGPGQPDEQPATQIAPQGGGAPPPQQGGYQPPPPQQGGYQQPSQQGGYQQPPQQGGYPQQGGGGFPGGPGYPGAPGGYGGPPSGGGSKKGLIIAIVAGVVALAVAAALILILVLGGDDDDDKDSKGKDDASSSESDSPSESASESPSESDSPSDPVTSETVDPAGPTDDPTITAQAFLDSLLEGDCLAVEGLSTPEYFAREFTDQAGCEGAAGNLEMSNAEYTFDEPVTVGTFSTVTGDVYAPNTGKTLDSTWILDGDTGSWLISGFTYVEK